MPDFWKQIRIEFTNQRIEEVKNIINSMIWLAKTDYEIYKQTRNTVKWYWQAIIDLKRLTMKWIIESDLLDEFDKLILQPNRQDKINRNDNFWIAQMQELQAVARNESRIDDQSACYVKLNEFETEYWKYRTIWIPYSDTEKRKQRYAYTIIVKQPIMPKLRALTEKLQRVSF